MNIIKPGTGVTIGHGGLTEARVTKAIIEGDNLAVSYECVWWSGDERKTAWFQSFEVEPIDETSRINLNTGAA